MLPGKVRRTEGLSGDREGIPATGSVGKRTLVDQVAPTTRDVDEPQGPGDDGPNASLSDDTVTAAKAKPRMPHATNDAAAVKRPPSGASHRQLDDIGGRARDVQGRETVPLGTTGDAVRADVASDRIGVPRAAAAGRETTSERQDGASSDGRATSSAAAGSAATPLASVRPDGPLADAVVNAGGDAPQAAVMRARSADAEPARTPGATTGEPQQGGERGTAANANASGAPQLRGDHSAGGPADASGVSQLGGDRAPGTPADGHGSPQHRGDPGTGTHKDAPHTRTPADAHKAGPHGTVPAATTHAGDAHPAEAHADADHDAGPADAHVSEQTTAGKWNVRGGGHIPDEIAARIKSSHFHADREPKPDK